MRCLAIKGPVLEAQRLRHPGSHQSIDVDVWVDPSQRRLLLDELLARGWQERIPSTTESVGPRSAVALAHAAWPVEIDLHDRFPGFLAPPQEVFELLWRRRATVAIAGCSVPATDRASTLAVTALHVLRTPQHRALEIESVRETFRRRLTDEEQRDLVDLAAATGATLTLAPVLRGLTDYSNDLPTDPAALESWTVLTESEGKHSTAWVYALKSASPRAWPGILRRAVLLSEPEIRLLYPTLPPHRLGLWWGRLRRLVVGARSLPSAVRIVAAARHRDGKGL